MNNVILLTAVPMNTAVFIFDIKKSPCSDRLNELGFTKGTRIVPLHESPGRSAAAYFVKGAVIALRNTDADTIYVSMEESCYD